MRQKLFVALLVLISAAYCWGLGWIAWGFVRAGTPLGVGLAVAVVVLLALTIWVTWREVLFGLASGRLAARYADEGAPVRADATDETADGTAAAPSGPAPAEADGPAAASGEAAQRAEFEAARTAVREGGQDDWRAWFRLALAYDALRDRRNARMATRSAIEAARRG